MSLIIGPHLSTSGGFTQMGLEALKIGASTFQFFTRNPRGGRAKEIELSDAEGLLEIIEKNNFGKILGHAPYTINPASAKENVVEFAHMAMADDLNRMECFPNNYYNFHPGSHVGQGLEKGVDQIVNLLNTILRKDQTTIFLLETMAGKGTEIGSRFEELRMIIDGVDLDEKMGVCLDTCHVFEAGYDIVNDLDGVLEEFNSIIGIERLKAIHLNDSKNQLGAAKDRHEKIGEGSLGIETFRKIVNHPWLRDLPFYLETPNEIEGYGEEIVLLNSLIAE